MIEPRPQDQLRQFIAKFDERNQALIRAVRRKVRCRFTTAHELVYDNYNFLVIGYSPTERPSDAVLSVTANANGVGLCFIHGATLPDPAGLLQGSGKQTRFIRLPSAAILDDPAVQALITAAVAQSNTRFAATGRGKLIIRSVSVKQRPRRNMSFAARGRLNAEWHVAHRMPKNATLEQRLQWHVEHAQACGCREMPKSIRAELSRRGPSDPTGEALWQARS